MKQTRKGNQWYFGIKAYIGVDAVTGLTYSVAAKRSTKSPRAELFSSFLDRARSPSLGARVASNHKN